MVDRQTFNLRAGSSILPAPTVRTSTLTRKRRSDEASGSHLGSHLVRTLCGDNALNSPFAIGRLRPHRRNGTLNFVALIRG